MNDISRFIGLGPSDILDIIKNANDNGSVDLPAVLVARRVLATDSRYKQALQAEVDHQEMLQREILAGLQVEALEAIRGRA